MIKVNRHNNLKVQDKLSNKVAELVKLTATGNQKWDVIVSTTEYNDSESKPTEEIDGKEYVIDECFVSYHTIYKGEEFLLVSYEMIHTCGSSISTNNMIFMPPLGNRFFDVRTLINYAVENDQMLTYQVHQLWDVILSEKKKDNPNIELSVEKRELIIEE